MSNTADAIKSLRMERAWSQEQLGAIAGTSARTIQRLERGQPPSLETLKALAAAFDVPVAWLSPERPTATSEDSDMTATEQNHDTNHRRFRRHLAAYAAIIGGLTVLNLVRNPEHLWVIYPALGWGVPLVLQGLKLARPPARFP